MGGERSESKTSQLVSGAHNHVDGDRAFALSSTAHIKSLHAAIHIELALVLSLSRRAACTSPLHVDFTLVFRDLLTNTSATTL